MCENITFKFYIVHSLPCSNAVRVHWVCCYLPVCFSNFVDDTFSCHIFELQTCNIRVPVYSAKLVNPGSCLPPYQIKLCRMNSALVTDQRPCSYPHEEPIAGLLQRNTMVGVGVDSALPFPQSWLRTYGGVMSRDVRGELDCGLSDWKQQHKSVGTWHGYDTVESGFPRRSKGVSSSCGNTHSLYL